MFILVSSIWTVRLYACILQMHLLASKSSYLLAFYPIVCQKFYSRMTPLNKRIFTFGRYNDEICILWDHCGDDLQACHPHTQGPVQQVAPARRELRWWLRSRGLLCHCLPPCWQSSFIPQQCQRSHCWRREWSSQFPALPPHTQTPAFAWLVTVLVLSCSGGQEARTVGALHSRASSAYCDDRHPHRCSVGDLWRLQSLCWPVGSSRSIFNTAFQKSMEAV